MMLDFRPKVDDVRFTRGNYSNASSTTAFFNTAAPNAPLLFCCTTTGSWGNRIRLFHGFRNCKNTVSFVSELQKHSKAFTSFAITPYARNHVSTKRLVIPIVDTFGGIVLFSSRLCSEPVPRGISKFFSLLI